MISDRLRGDQGLTVLEVLIAAAIMGLVVSAALGALFASTRSWQRGQADAEVQSTLRAGVDQVSRELRTARRIDDGGPTDIRFVVPKRCADGDTTGSVTCGSPGITGRDFDFRKNLSGDYFVPDGVTIRYRLEGNRLVRYVNGTAKGTARSPVAQCGSTPVFAYNDPSPASATVVTVTLCGTATRRGGAVASTSEVRVLVRLRNATLRSSSTPATPAALARPLAAA